MNFIAVSFLLLFHWSTRTGAHCGNLFRPGKVYTFSVSGNTLKLPAVGGLEIEYVLQVVGVGGNKILLKTRDVRLFSKYNMPLAFEHKAQAESYLETPVEVTFHPYGNMTSLKVTPNLPQWALDFKRAQASHLMLTIRNGKQYTTEEITTLGHCLTQYTFDDKMSTDHSNAPDSNSFWGISDEDDVWSLDFEGVGAMMGLATDIGKQWDGHNRELQPFCRQESTFFEIYKTVSAGACKKRGIQGIPTDLSSTTHVLACGQADRQNLTILKIFHTAITTDGEHLVENYLLTEISYDNQNHVGQVQTELVEIDASTTSYRGSTDVPGSSSLPNSEVDPNPILASLLAVSRSIQADHESHERLKMKVPNADDDRPYDYIIVGGGSAGCVIAGRLSENPTLRVLLLEEGDVQNVANDIPAMDLVNTVTTTAQLHLYITEPQMFAAQGLSMKRVAIGTAKVLGGGSTINGMFFNRGGPGDYDGWAKDYGAIGWSYADVLPFFKKSEDQTDPLLIQDTVHHSTGGPLTITSPDLSTAEEPYRLLSNVFVKAATEIGYPPTDINGPRQLGSSRIQRTVRNGKRLTTATAFLQPAVNRPNLYILTGARVTKVNFNGKHVTGVEYNRNGRRHVAMVNRVGGEVILSAGAIESAKLLLLSGVGPKEDLEPLGIPVVADLPVGHNLQDHARIAGVDFVVNTTLFSPWTGLTTLDNLDLLYQNGTGPLASQYYLHQAGIINIRTSVMDSDATFGPSDLFLSPALLPNGNILLTAGEPGINSEILDKYYSPHYGAPTLNIFTALNYVRSRGQVKLRSANPSDLPSVNPAYLTHPADIARLVEAYKVALNLGHTWAFRSIGAEPYPEVLPGCEHVFDSSKSAYKQSDDYIECKIRHLSATEYHVSGTCKMGPSHDRTAVVDPRLKVLGGINGLRVVDASIMPSIVTGNPMAPVIMIGEKASAMILEDRELG